MGRLRSWLKRLERESQDEQIAIVQQDGTVVKFPKGAEAESFGHECERLVRIYRGEPRGEPHPLVVARRNERYPRSDRIVLDADKQPDRQPPGSWQDV